MRILYFAELKDIVALESENFNIPYEVTVDDFKSRLYERYPELQTKTFQIAINEEFARDEDEIKPNDTVALIPPVSGG